MSTSSSVEVHSHKGSCGNHVCPRCEKPRTCREFTYRNSSGPDGRNRSGERVTPCKVCLKNLRRNDYRKRDPERAWKYLIGWKYNLSPERYQELLTAQGGRCAICSADAPGGRGSKWSVDHNHACCPGDRSCGECVRGLLCSRCNTGIGLLMDNPDVMRKAAEYVERKL